MTSCRVEESVEAPGRHDQEVLVVCDNSEDTAELRRICTDARWAVHWAATLTRALQVLAKNSIAVVVGQASDIRAEHTEYREIVSIEPKTRSSTCIDHGRS